MDYSFYDEKESLEKTESIRTRTSIVGLFGKEKLEEIQKKIAKVTGLAFVTVDYKGEPVTEATGFTEFCQKVRGREHACSCCKRSDAFGAQQAVISRKPSIYFCPCDLLEVAIPIEDRGVFLGGFIGGQIICKDAPPEVTRLKQLFHQKNDITDNEEMQQLRAKAKECSYDEFVNIVNLVHLIINQLCEDKSSHAEDTKDLRKNLKELNKENKELRSSKEKLELQIANIKMNQNPYFVSNTLSSISNLALLEDAPQTNSLIYELAEYMKGSNRLSNTIITLGEEIEQIEHYIRLSCAKYEQGFSYQIRIVEKLRNREVPAYSILPFVANAIYYGIALQQGKGKLEIEGILQNGLGMLTISENGPGLSAEEVQARFQIFEGGYEGKYINKAMHKAGKQLVAAFGEACHPEITMEAGVGRKFLIKIPAMIADEGILSE